MDLDFGTVNYADSTVNGESMDSLSPTAIEMVGASGDQLDSTSGMGSPGDFSNTWMAESQLFAALAPRGPEAHEPPGPEKFQVSDRSSAL